MAKVDLFNSTYRNFETDVLARIRQETFGTDFGQNSWTTAEEYFTFISHLRLAPGHHILDVASGSGGPALFLAREGKCRVTGVDINENGVAAARKRSETEGLRDRVTFEVGDGSRRLSFEDGTFDAIVCIDSIIQLPDRRVALSDWYRMLKPGGRVLYTDPVVVTGPVTHEEFALRSSIGFFVFVPPGVNEEWIKGAGFTLIRKEDVTESMAQVSRRWHESRERHRSDLLKIEGEERYKGLQTFFKTVDQLSTERRLSRFAYVAEK